MENPFLIISSQLLSIHDTLLRIEKMMKENSGVRPSEFDRGSLYVSKKHAAKILDCSTSTIDNYARSGLLKRHHIGKTVKFLRAEIAALAKRNMSTKEV